MTMDEFGKAIDIKCKSGTVANWETNKNKPNNARLKRIAELGNIPIDELISNDINIGDKIKSIRLSLGKTMAEFGEMFEPQASDSIVSRWEKSISTPNAKRIEKIAELGNVTVDELLNTNAQMLMGFDNNISCDLNSIVPKLFIEGMEVEVVSMTRHYITNNNAVGSNVVTFVYLVKGSTEQKVLSINLETGETFRQ